MHRHLRLAGLGQPKGSTRRRLAEVLQHGVVAGGLRRRGGGGRRGAPRARPAAEAGPEGQTGEAGPRGQVRAAVGPHVLLLPAEPLRAARLADAHREGAALPRRHGQPHGRRAAQRRVPRDQPAGQGARARRPRPRDAPGLHDLRVPGHLHLPRRGVPRVQAPLPERPRRAHGRRAVAAVGARPRGGGLAAEPPAARRLPLALRVVAHVLLRRGPARGGRGQGRRLLRGQVRRHVRGHVPLRGVVPEPRAAHPPGPQDGRRGDGGPRLSRRVGLHGRGLRRVPAARRRPRRNRPPLPTARRNARARWRRRGRCLDEPLVRRSTTNGRSRTRASTS